MNVGGGKVIGDVLGGKANSDQNGQGTHIQNTKVQCMDAVLELG